MHPVLSQALAAERVKDMRARAAARDLARTARRNHRRGRAAGTHYAAPQAASPAPQPADAVPQTAGLASQAPSLVPSPRVAHAAGAPGRAVRPVHLVPSQAHAAPDPASLGHDGSQPLEEECVNCA